MEKNELLELVYKHGFACDSMLKGLARWLRAGGYDAQWSYTIEDNDLVDMARKEKRILLTPTCPG